MERGILVWIIVGLIAGALAKLIMPGKDPGGIIMTIILGIGGSILGGWLATALLGATMLVLAYSRSAAREATA